MKRYVYLLLTFCIQISFAQEKTIPVLERQVSINAVNTPVETVFASISSQADFVFSYSPNVISDVKYVSVNARNKSVRYVFNQLLEENNIDYKVKGKYVILKKKSRNTDSQTDRIFEGYVYDSKTGKKLTEASIYDQTLMASVVTDEYGYFSMEIPADKPIKSLQVSKLGYTDTILISIDNVVKNRNIEISLKQDDTIQRKNGGVDFQKFSPGWIVPDKLKINARNITTPAFRTVQISLIPFLSTNKLLGGVVTNDISLNTTIGYVNSVRYLELGGGVNFVRRNVSYVQGAGIGNVVGRNVTGFQGAGIFNVTRTAVGMQGAGIFNQAESVKGVQGAGIFNHANDSASVQLAGIGNSTKNTLIQGAGIFNFAKRVAGAQAAGIVNSAGSIRGVQAAGIANRSGDTATVQLAGIGNFSGNSVLQTAGIFNQAGSAMVQLSGIYNSAESTTFQAAGLINDADLLEGNQMAGLYNKSRSSSNIQIAGLMNNADGDANIQLAGLVNTAKHVKTLQLALINFADTVSGLSVGLFSFIKKGYHKLEISADESFPFNIAFRTGSYKFHTFITTGTSLAKDKGLWTVGYGLGTSWGNPNKTLVDFDFSTNEVSYRNDLKGAFHWYKVYLGIDRRMFKKFSIAAGLTFNALLSDSFEPDYNEINSRMPFYYLTNKDYPNGHNLKTWIGGRVGLRFF